MRMRHVVWTALALGGLGLSTPAQAQAEARSRGTHGLLELEVGADLSGGVGPAGAITVGAGGMLPGFPARFYLLGRFGASEYQQDSDAALLRSGRAREHGSFQDLTLGPRVYLPLWGGLRWYADAMVGVSHVSGRYEVSGRAPLQADDWLALATVATGLQLRVMRALSVGVRAAFAFNEAGLVGVMRDGGVQRSVRPSLMGGVTWHF